jgi:hypothetical protein
MMTGMVGTPMQLSRMPGGGQGGSPMMGSGSGAPSAGYPTMGGYYQPYESADGYGRPTLSTADTGSAQQTSRTQELTALRRYGGGLDWPVALRYLTREDDWKELRERIDARVEQVLGQPAGRSLPEDALQDLKQDVKRLRQHFERQGEDLPTTSRQANDARRFLRKVQSALVQASSSSAVSTYR